MNRETIGLLFVMFIVNLSNAFGESSMIRVRGSVSNFSGELLENAVIHFKDECFNSLFTAYTDKKGEFNIEFEDRTYTIIAVKDYIERYLEYWHWNYRPKANQQLDMKIDGIELYGMKAWTARPTYDGLIVYVRPMSLKRWIEAGRPTEGAAIAPELTIDDVSVTINNQIVTVRGINKVKEFITPNSALDAYLIHIDPSELSLSRATVCMTLHDQKTSEKGMGCIDTSE